MTQHGHTLDAVVFDFGSTLFGHASLADTIAQAGRQLGVPIPADEAAEAAARIDAVAQSAAELALGRDLDPVVWETRTRAWYAWLDSVADGLADLLYLLMHSAEQWVPYTASRSTVQALSEAGVPIGVLSNTGWDVRAVFRRHGVDPFITAYGLSYEIGAVKPEPKAFEHVCAMLGSSPQRTLMVGDDRRADAGAVAVGMPTLLLPVVPVGADNGIAAVARLFV